MVDVIDLAATAVLEPLFWIVLIAFLIAIALIIGSLAWYIDTRSKYNMVKTLLAEVQKSEQSWEIKIGNVEVKVGRAIK